MLGLNASTDCPPQLHLAVVVSVWMPLDQQVLEHPATKDVQGTLEYLGPNPIGTDIHSCLVMSMSLEWAGCLKLLPASPVWTDPPLAATAARAQRPHCNPIEKGRLMGVVYTLGVFCVKPGAMLLRERYSTKWALVSHVCR